MVMKTEWHEITTLDDFREIKRQGTGYIVITDTANPNKIHRVKCGWVKEENFITKVIENNCRNGHYYWTNDFHKGNDWGAGPCGSCL